MLKHTYETIAIACKLQIIGSKIKTFLYRNPPFIYFGNLFFDSDQFNYRKNENNIKAQFQK